MVKKTYRNFIYTMEVLQHQAGMTAAEAERRTRQIFDAVERYRAQGIKTTVENYLVSEINNYRRRIELGE